METSEVMSQNKFFLFYVIFSWVAETNTQDWLPIGILTAMQLASHSCTCAPQHPLTQAASALFIVHVLTGARPHVYLSPHLKKESERPPSDYIQAL